MSKIKKSIINTKMLAIILAFIMVISLCSSVFYEVFAEGELTIRTCFKGNGWGADSITEGVAVYNYETSSVKLKIAKTQDSGITYEYTAIDSSYENNIILNGEYQYKLEIDDSSVAEGVNYQLLINGTSVQIPGDKKYGLNEEDFNNNDIVNIDISFQPTPPGPNGPPEEQANMEIWIGDTKVIDDTAEPPITSYTGTGFEIHPGSWHSNYELEFTGNNVTPVEAIRIEGNGIFIISTKLNEDDNYEEDPNTYTINADISGYSIRSENAESRIDVETMQGGGRGNFKLLGGVKIKGSFGVLDHNVQIGTSNLRSSKGITASNVVVDYAKLEMYCSGELFSGLSAENKMDIDVLNQAELKGNTTGTALNNVRQLAVNCAGKIDITHAGTLGDTLKKARYYDFVNFETTEQVEEGKDVIELNAVEGTFDKYKMMTSSTNFLLQSLVKPLYTLSFNMVDENGNIVEDTKVEHGTVKIKTACGIGRGADGRGFNDFRIEQGTPVTIELLPDYGYQFTSGAINGEAITSPEGEVATYTFNMPSNHLHLQAVFTKTEDTIVVNNKAIEGAKISNLEGQINGNAEFKVEEVTKVNDAAFNKAAEGLNIAGFANLSLNEVILKGSEDEAWKVGVTDLDEEMTVTLKVSDEIAKQLANSTECGVLRDHNGVMTLLKAKYNPDTKEITFNTNGYSNYAIAYKSADTTIKDATPKTGN